MMISTGVTAALDVTSIAGFVYFTINIVTLVGGSFKSKASKHHLISHTLLMVSLVLSLNVMLRFDIEFPFILTVLYLIQHLVKEDVRLVNTGDWKKQQKCPNEYKLNKDNR